MVNLFKLLSRLPRKRTSASALFFNHRDEILIVKPKYQKEWLTPGGLIELNESPLEACIREVKEELGLEVPIRKLLGVEYNPDQGQGGDGIAFMFYGGRLSEEQIARIKLQWLELSEFRFVPRSDLSLLSQKLQKRILRCLDGVTGSRVVYLEGGSIMF